MTESFKSFPAALAGPHANPVDVPNIDADLTALDPVSSENGADLAATDSFHVWTPPAGAVAARVSMDAGANTLVRVRAFSAKYLADHAGDVSAVLDGGWRYRIPAGATREPIFAFPPGRQVGMKCVEGGLDAVELHWILGE